MRQTLYTPLPPLKGGFYLKRALQIPPLMGDKGGSKRLTLTEIKVIFAKFAIFILFPNSSLGTHLSQITWHIPRLSGGKKLALFQKKMIFVKFPACSTSLCGEND